VHRIRWAEASADKKSDLANNEEPKRILPVRTIRCKLHSHHTNCMLKSIGDRIPGRTDSNSWLAKKKKQVEGVWITGKDSGLGNAGPSVDVQVEHSLAWLGCY
jgi:hypothetical protein